MRHKRSVFNLLLLSAIAALGIWMLILNAKNEIVALGLPSMSGDKTVRVMTLNLYSEGEDFDELEMAFYVLRQEADVVALNEFSEGRCHEMDSLLRCAYSYSTSDAGLSGKPNRLYSKFPIRETRSVAGEGVTACTIDSEHGKFRLYYCHLASNNDGGMSMGDAMDANSKDSWRQYWIAYHQARKRRAQEVEQLCQDMDAQPHLPTMVIGDLNDFSVSPALKPLVDRGMRNAWWQRGIGYGSTYKLRYVRLRIDHIFYSKDLDCTDVEVVETGNLSDHDGLIADIELP